MAWNIYPSTFHMAGFVARGFEPNVTSPESAPLTTLLMVTLSLRFSNILVSGALMLLPYGNWSLPSLLGHCPLAKLKGLPILFMQQNVLTRARCPGDRHEAGRHRLCPDGAHSPEETINAHVDMKSHTALSSPRMGNPSQEEGGNRTRNWHRESLLY